MSKLPASDQGLATRDAVAIVGIGCRFPGVTGVSAFWDVLRDGTETTADYPGGRFPYIDGVYAGSEIATRRGGFLANLDRFDADFFGISPREAALLDPQQRLLLEVGWEAVEDAGIPLAKIAGSQTGVFIGLWNSDYEHCLYDQPGELDFHATTGGGRYSASGRLAFALDLRGPNLTVDTACSSSLVAIHLACQSLQLGESEMAIAGGVNAILRPEITLTYSAAKMLSPDGRSKFGDSAANGYVRSEGAGLVLLKPLSRALADKDPIYALIRGSAVNNDGRSSGLLVSPSRQGQEALLRGALRNARIEPGEIDYIEAHGTGTLVGDPVEIETIGRVVNTPTRRRPCSLGSVKTNIGHTESAAGAAGVIKVALALERGVLPASLHVREPNPAIAWSELSVRLQRETGAWPHAEPVRLAGVSGFGITGTNAHVILENFRSRSSSPAAAADEYLFLLSGHSPEALREVAASWGDRLKSEPSWPPSLADLAYTASVRRTHQDHRLAVTARSRQELESRISAWLKDDAAQGVQAGRRLDAERGKVVFVFPGQGGQWPGMALGLMKNVVFREALAQCDEAIRKYRDWSVIDRLMGSQAEPIEDIDAVQPCLFSVMVALAAVWRSRGIEPQAVVGHSMGECAAAVVAGALSVEDGAALLCHRSRLMKNIRRRGLMAVAELPLSEATALVNEYDGRISVAANNSPSSTVLSGDADDIEDALRRLQEREVFCRRIKVEVASHSPHVDPLLGELGGLLSGIRPRTGSIPLYSTTTGRIEDGSRLGGDYWCRNLRQPVLFSSEVQRLLADGFDTFVEINAHPVLLQSIEEGIRHSGKKAVAVASLKRDQPDAEEMQNALGALHVSGFPVDFRRLYPEGECLRLPTYAWQRERYWIEASDTKLRTTATAFASDCKDDLYELRWTEEKTFLPGTAASGLWILLSRGDDAALALAARLSTSGEECVCVSNTEELRRTLQASDGFCRGVIRFATTKGADAHEASAEAFDIANTVRAITTADLASTPRLFLLSTGIWHLESDGEVSAAQGPGWALGRVIAAEHADLRCVNIDLSSAPDETELGAVAGLLRQNELDEQTAVRGAKCFVARYQRITEGRDGAAPRFKGDATYLLTGGLGGIGLNVAKWMANLGARHLALVSRRPPNDAMREQIAVVESLGAEVRVFQADVADDAQVAALLAKVRTEMPPLRGVFHLPAITEAAWLRDLEWDSLERVMRSKALAGWTLHRHITEDLDFFVLFSSIAAVVGQPGLGSYASANAYVDALARYRRAKGLKAQSIQWSPWVATGLGNDERVQRGVRFYQNLGVRPLAAEGALEGLGRIMTLDQPGILVLPVDWGKFARSFESTQPPRAFVSLLPRAGAEVAEAPIEAIREKLEKMDPGARRSALETHLQEKLAMVLKTGVARIDPAKPFGSMGVDSLMGLEFVRRVTASTSLPLPATLVFNYPTIQALAGEIGRRMGIPLDGKSAVKAGIGEAQNIVSAAPELTDEEAIEALMGRRT
jgi:acyl transferase domain-containing protein